VSGRRAIALDLEALGDTRALWHDWLASAHAVLGDAGRGLPDDRAAAAVALDESDSANWRVLLERFAEDRAPVYLRPAAEVSAALRRLANGASIVVFTDAPVELARLALAHLGATRRVAGLETGAGALERAIVAAGPDATVVRTREALLALTSIDTRGANPSPT
jgi:phosphoglycolate phosphatase-like HAD superfamily hydrolase